MTNKDPFIIRSATETDLPQVIDLDQEAFEPYGTAKSAVIITARLGIFPEGFVVLTDPNNVILGYGSAEKWLHRREPGLDEDPSLTHHPDGRIFCITAMAVRRAQWRRGFGAAILERLITIAQQQRCSEIVLETTHAQGFYQRRGFQVLKERQQRDVNLSILGLDLSNI